MPLSNLFRRKKVDLLEQWRARLLQSGRITDGVIMDTGNDESGSVRQIYFSYEVSGVEYESSQLLSTDQRLRESDYFPGAYVTIRYDPQHPGNSIVV
ncbi:MAG: hypothetical protein QOJ64_2835 [Acidobacteriota bacterium]|jgi:hypothetical protein|nr:hypothetical protein [Acidobacteriota bacterium]